MRRTLVLLALPALLSGCIPAVIGAGAETGVSIAENRSIGRKVDDNVIYADINDIFAKANQVGLIADVTFNVRYARVMLTGRVKSADDAEKAVALTWKATGVQEVINELQVNKESGFLDTASDALVKRNLEGRLLITKDVWVINYSMDVQSGTAYLIGRVKDRGELDRVLNVARTTKGVKKVVSHLQIITDAQNAAAVSSAAPAGNGSSNSGSAATSRPTAPYTPASATPLQDSVTSGPTIINTSSSVRGGSAPVGGVEAPGSVSSSDLGAPVKR
jgi:osmotically-inducible protein OsmY